MALLVPDLYVPATHATHDAESCVEPRAHGLDRYSPSPHAAVHALHEGIIDTDRTAWLL